MTSERSRIPCLSAAAAEGTGKKQQEGRAMATLDRKVPSPEAFLGKPWSSWIDAAKIHCSDNVDLEEAGKEGGKSREVMRLNKEDWHLSQMDLDLDPEAFELMVRAREISFYSPGNPSPQVG
ncbi:Ataxin-7-like protein 1 [Pteropus alecto]|uniref:Ataxin-7-like protein 1 n=1 Tax=Pteropus alecto TaxID=9402 RepID=L5JSX9_PTEAL|nr:Ataxin-7-like protein 1 [Pteropus alecto]